MVPFLQHTILCFVDYLALTVLTLFSQVFFLVYFSALSIQDSMIKCLQQLHHPSFAPWPGFSSHPLHPPVPQDSWQLAEGNLTLLLVVASTEEGSQASLWPLILDYSVMHFRSGSLPVGPQCNSTWSLVSLVCFPCEFFTENFKVTSKFTLYLYLLHRRVPPHPALQFLFYFLDQFLPRNWLAASYLYKTCRSTLSLNKRQKLASVSLI